MILYYGRGQLNEFVGDPNGILDVVSNINHFIHMAFSVVDHESVIILVLFWQNRREFTHD